MTSQSQDRDDVIAWRRHRGSPLVTSPRRTIARWRAKCHQIRNMADNSCAVLRRRDRLKHKHWKESVFIRGVSAPLGWCGTNLHDKFPSDFRRIFIFRLFFTILEYSIILLLRWFPRNFNRRQKPDWLKYWLTMPKLTRENYKHWLGRRGAICVGQPRAKSKRRGKNVDSESSQSSVATNGSGQTLPPVTVENKESTREQKELTNEQVKGMCEEGRKFGGKRHEARGRRRSYLDYVGGPVRFLRLNSPFILQTKFMEDFCSKIPIIFWFVVSSNLRWKSS